MLAALFLLLLQDDAIEKIRAGQTPDRLSELTDPRILDAIADQIRKRGPFTDAVALHLCAHGGRAHADALVALLGHASVRVAYGAVFALAALLDEKLLPLLETALDAKRDLQLRALTVLAEARFPPAAPLLEKRVALLDAADRDRSKAMLRAIASSQARGTHDAVLAYYEKTEEDLAVRALGRLWEMRLDDPPRARADEIRRLSSLLFIRRLAMGGATNETYADAMLRLLARDEFEKFLRDFSGESFFARRVVAAAAMQRSFDRAKGTLLVEAFLGNPDAGLVGQILLRSPWDLPKERLAPLLDRKDEAKIDDAPARMCDLAVRRLSRQIDRREIELPAELEKRDALVREWKARLNKNHR